MTIPPFHISMLTVGESRISSVLLTRMVRSAHISKLGGAGARSFTDRIDDAIPRAYYAMVYAADGVIAGSKHSAVVAAYGREYAKTGKNEPQYHQMRVEDCE